MKVAFFAEGIDVNNPEFVRPDGGEAFGDAFPDPHKKPLIIPQPGHQPS